MPWEFSEQVGGTFRGCDVLCAASLQLLASALLCEPQESQHEINIFYAKTTHGLRTVTVIMWIPQTCDLCLSCELVRTTVPVSATEQTRLCVWPALPSAAQAGAACILTSTAQWACGSS